MLNYKTYRLSEEEPWVVFVHGAGGSSRVWFKQIKDFSNHFNVLLIDLRGHGDSKEAAQDYFDSDYHFEGISQDIIEVLNHLEIGKAHFVGISLGTILIRQIGEINPGRVQSMVLGGAVTKLNYRSKSLVVIGNFLRKVIPFMWFYRAYAWIIMPKKHHHESRSLFIKEAQKIYNREVHRWFQLLHELNPLLNYHKEKELPIPTLYLMGAEDFIFLGQVRSIVKVHQHALLQVIKDSGHVCNVDQPEAFNRLSINFIKKVSI